MDIQDYIEELLLAAGYSKSEIMEMDLPEMRMNHIKKPCTTYVQGFLFTPIFIEFNSIMMECFQKLHL